MELLKSAKTVREDLNYDSNLLSIKDDISLSLFLQLCDTNIFKAQEICILNLKREYNFKLDWFLGTISKPTLANAILGPKLHKN